MKLFATDYDGTITFHGVSDEFRAAIGRWTAAGNLFGVVSGRPYMSILRAVRKDALPADFIVANNGAVIVTYEGGEEHVRSVMDFPPELALRLLAHFAPEEHHFCRIDAVMSYSNYDAIPAAELRDGKLTVGDTVYPEVTEITVDYPDLSASLAGADRVNAAFGGILRAVPPGSQSIDCMREDVRKSDGIRHLISLLGIRPEKIYTTGDSPNDLDMLLCPDFEGYAVENALPNVREAVGRTVADPLALLTRLLGEETAENA